VKSWLKQLQTRPQLPPKSGLAQGAPIGGQLSQRTCQTSVFGDVSVWKVGDFTWKNLGKMMENWDLRRFNKEKWLEVALFASVNVG
jgi:hypothetical protein